MDTSVVNRLRKMASSQNLSTCCALVSAFYRSSEREFSGFVMDSTNPHRKFTIEILVDGHPVRVVRADALIPALVETQDNDGCYGFFCSLDAAALNDSAIVEARLANLGASVGTPIVITQQPGSRHDMSAQETVRWLGGLRFSGWIADRKTCSFGSVFVDGSLVMRIRASTWCHIGNSPQDARAVRAFDFHLPEKFADGAVHKITLTSENDEKLGECSIFFIAYADGMREALIGRGVSERECLRAEIFDQLLPMSAPFSKYSAWRERSVAPSDVVTMSKGGVILVGAGNPEITLATLEQQIGVDWVAAAVPPTSGPTGFLPRHVKVFLQNDGAECEFILFTHAGTLLEPTALRRIATAFEHFPDAKAVYGDLEIKNGDGFTWPVALSAFDYERMLEQGYCAHLFALRRTDAERLLRTGAANLYRLFNSILDIESISSSGIVHIPDPLGTLPDFDRVAAQRELLLATRARSAA